jgi:hypothetical protein
VVSQWLRVKTAELRSSFWTGDWLTAANDLGLTTAVPAHVTVLADARLGTIRLGNQEIRFKHAAA